MCGGAALFLAGISLICARSGRAFRHRVLSARNAAMMAVLCMGGLSRLIAPVPLVALFTVMLLCLVVDETASTGTGEAHTESG